VADESIVKAAQGYLRLLKQSGLPVTFGVLFGSQVSSRQHEWSDIDLLVVSPQFDLRRSRDDITLMWYVAAKVDSRIEPIPCGDKQWLEDKVSTIIEVARREGQIVAPAPA
jgi:predicted nucleotidyltransferase